VCWATPEVPDALVAGARLLGSLAAVGLDRVLGSGEVPAGLADVTPGWLTAALRPRDPQVSVTGVRRLGHHSGTTTRARIALEYGGPAASAERPATLFVKITPAGLVQRVFVHAMGLAAAELRFYRELAAQVPVRVPAVFAARAGPGARRFALLLEDLAARGGRFVAVGERASVADARAVLGELARLHAAFWESPRFGADLAWVRSLESRARDLPLERFLTSTMLRAARRRFGAAMPAQFDAACRLVCERRDALERVWARGPRTLVHGDCHIGNLFFEGERPGFLDWQVLARAPGLRDVSYFLCNSLAAEAREGSEEALLDHYLAGLRAAGAPAPSPEEAWRGYRRFALYAWLSAAFTAAAGSGLQEARIARAGLERTTRALVSLGTVELVEAEARA
jgi:Ser/Thr protein kinase RdoA (MazF antagonist)